MITLHHLHQSRSFRVAWLMEELDLKYDLVCHERAPDGSRPVLAAIHPFGRAPLIDDDGLVMFESGAILDYVVHRHGHGRLAVPSHHADFPAYLTWLHAAEGSCMPALAPFIAHRRRGGAPPTPAQSARLAATLLAANAALQGPPHDWFGGHAFSIADIMMYVPLVLAARVVPQLMDGCPALIEMLHRLEARPAFRHARDVVEPQMPYPV